MLKSLPYSACFLCWAESRTLVIFLKKSLAVSLSDDREKTENMEYRWVMYFSIIFQTSNHYHACYQYDYLRLLLFSYISIYYNYFLFYLSLKLIIQ